MDFLFSPFQIFSDWVVKDVLRLDGRLAETFGFFLYDAPKILALMAAIIFAVAVLRTYLPADKIRAWAAARGPVAGYGAAAALGVVTPFCSCSAVPVFIGLSEAGLPLAYAFTFLVASPMVNEVAMAILLGSFGLTATALYVVAGLIVAVASGWWIGRGNPERFLVKYARPKCACGGQESAWAFRERLRYAAGYAWSTLLKTAPFVLVGVAVGAGVHGYAPQDAIAAVGNAWYGVPLATLAGVPLYANHAAILPAAQALLGKGAHIGVVLAFVMAVTALSVPEFILLRRVMRPALIARFAATVAVGIMAVGYVFYFTL